MTWVDTISNALNNIGGKGHLDEIYAEVINIKPDLGKNWTARVRATLEENSSDSIAWKQKRDLFHKTNPKQHDGFWELRSMNKKLKNPLWSTDETILCLDFYLKHRPNIPNTDSAKLVELQAILKTLNDREQRSGNSSFRNNNGVYMKLMNLQHLDPSIEGGLPRNSKVDRAVWKNYADDPQQLREIANTIKLAIQSKDIPLEEMAVDMEEECEEGRVYTKLHKFYERNHSFAKKKKKAVLHKHGILACEACGFDFSNRYGEKGFGFIECHHNKPVSELRPGEKTKMTDLSLLCANCHRIIHRSKPWLTISELKHILEINHNTSRNLAKSVTVE